MIGFRRFLKIFENPICISEVRRGLRGVKIFIVLSIYLIILTVVLYVIWSAASDSLMRNQEVGRTILASTAVIQFIFILLMCPSFTCGAISSEKERKTYELLITSLLEPPDIVLGKLFYSIVYTGLFLLASLPFSCTAFFFGGVSPFEIICVYLILLLIAIFISLMGLYYSSRFNSTSASMRSAYLTMFFLFMFVTNIIPVFIYGNMGPVPHVPFIFFTIPLWLFAIINFLFIMIIIFYSTLAFLEVPSPKRRLIIRVLWALMLLFNFIAIFGGFTGELAQQGTDLEDISSLMSLFYSIVITIGFMMVLGFSCDPPGKGKFSLKGLFYSDSRASSFFALFLIFIVLVSSSFIFFIYEPLFRGADVIFKTSLSIAMTLIILLGLTFIARLSSKIFSRKIYSQIVLITVTLLISFLPFISFIGRSDKKLAQTLTGFTYLEPYLALISIWMDDKIYSISFAGFTLPIISYSFVIYALLLLFLMVLNAFIRGKVYVRNL